MSRRRPTIPQRKRVFIGCEGASEASYCALLARLAEGPPRLHLHIEPHILQPGAGDPLELVKKAISTLRFEEKRRAVFAVKAIILDRGQPDKCAAATLLASKAGILLVWQDPDHEALLLRHLPNCQQKRPPRGASLAALQREWPSYFKALPMLELARRISRAGVFAAASVEPDLQELLSAIGFVLKS